MFSPGFIFHFAVGLIASFLGSIPFGTVNISVIDTTIRENFQAGLKIAIAAGIVEIIQSFIAAHCSMFITNYISDNIYVSLFSLFLLIAIGSYFFFKGNPDSVKTKKTYKINNFAKGALLGLLNPQALPYYVFVITFLQARQWIDFEMGPLYLNVIAFLLGTSIGRFLALLMYGYLSLVIAERIQTVSSWMNKILGSIFYLLAAVQAIRLFL